MYWCNLEYELIFVIINFVYMNEDMNKEEN
jgi:hypothetical protein